MSNENLKGLEPASTSSMGQRCEKVGVLVLLVALVAQFRGGSRTMHCKEPQKQRNKLEQNHPGSQPFWDKNI